MNFFFTDDKWKNIEGYDLPISLNKLYFDLQIKPLFVSNILTLDWPKSVSILDNKKIKINIHFKVLFSLNITAT